MRKFMKVTALTVTALMLLTACSSKTAETSPDASKETTAETSVEASAETSTGSEETLMIAAAASLEDSLTKELIPLFESRNPGIKVEGTYDSSGKLQTQIEEGADVDVFFSAATKQMEALKEEGLMADDTIVNLLENKIVFIVPTGEEGSYAKFEDIADAESIALGDPESVPVGQYSEEALTNLGLWDTIQDKLSLGTNVTEVLNWVAEGSAKAGIVYATDAAQTDKVTVVAEAPEGSVKKAIYPVGMVKASIHQDAAKKWIEFLQSEEATAIFESNGFAAAAQ